MKPRLLRIILSVLHLVTMILFLLVVTNVIETPSEAIYNYSKLGLVLFGNLCFHLLAYLLNMRSKSNNVMLAIALILAVAGFAEIIFIGGKYFYIISAHATLANILNGSGFDRSMKTLLLGIFNISSETIDERLNKSRKRHATKIS